jgi:elongation factor 3
MPMPGESVVPLVNSFKTLSLTDDTFDLISSTFGDLTKNKSTTTERRQAASALKDLVAEHGIRVLVDGQILENVTAALDFTGSDSAREGALLAFEALATLHECEPHLIPLLPKILDKLADKKPNVKNAAECASKVLVKGTSAYAVHGLLLPLLFECMANEKKWQTIRGALNLLGMLALHSPSSISPSLPEIVPIVSDLTWYLKKDVKVAAIQALRDVCTTIDNKDIEKFLPAVIESIAEPDHVADCIKQLSAVTFVSRVTAPALSVIVPLLSRGLQEKKSTTLRQVAVIADNMGKLVDDRQVAHKFLPQLLSGLDRVLDTVGDPEIRYIAAKAIVTIIKVGGGDGANRNLDEILNMDFSTPVVSGIHHIMSKRDQERLEQQKKIDSEKRRLQKAKEDEHFKLDEVVTEEKIELLSHKDIMAALVDILNQRIPGAELDPFLQKSLDYIVELATALIHSGNFIMKHWSEQIFKRGYFKFIPDSISEDIFNAFHKKCDDLENERIAHLQDDDEENDEEGEVLCNCEFSLAYGGMILLNKANLKLKRGFRYGVCGRNGVGKVLFCFS